MSERNINNCTIKVNIIRQEKMKKIFLLSSLLLFSEQAVAQDAHRAGFYLGINGGLTFPTNSKGHIFDGHAQTSLRFDRGLTAGFMAGYDFGRFFRAEFEFNYKKADMDTFSVTYSPKTYNYQQSGEVRLFSYMANAYLQYPLTNHVVPYIGVGVGLADVKMDKPCALHKCHGTTGDRMLAYQGIVGVGVNITENITISADYRYFTTRAARFETNVLFEPTMKTRLSSHNVMIGIRYKF